MNVPEAGPAGPLKVQPQLRQRFTVGVPLQPSGVSQADLCQTVFAISENGGKSNSAGVARIVNYFNSRAVSEETTMLTHETPVATSIGIPERATPAAQKVVIVNGSAGILELVQTVLHPGHYDLSSVES